MAIALWRLAVGSSFRVFVGHFDVGKSTCVNITKEFLPGAEYIMKALHQISQQL